MADYEAIDEIPDYVESAESVRNNITRNATNELLGILICEGHRLPKDARTLLKTPRMTPIVDKCGGQYLYFGFETIGSR